ncbi:YdcF family protein [Hydrogenimonas sp. SS33]|uniref:YdcF family protein n=1 Tax=Hydrogenimonas leucolamina TaxID=2954236 RepID=UPI00336BCA51
MIHLLSKLFTALLLPPGLFVTLLAILAFLTRKGVRYTLAAAAFFLYLISIHPVADRLLEHYEAPYRHTALPSRADAVVSLGGGNIRGNPIPLVDETFKRHIYGMAIAKRLDIPLIVSGNGDDGYNEYLGLLDSLERLRPLLKPGGFNTSRRYVDRFAIIPETRSSDTYENARFSLKLIPKKDPVLIVVTSAYHMTRALRLFRLAGVKNVYPAAVNFYSLADTRPFGPRDFFPSMEALQNSYRALHEFFGLVKVKMRELKEKSQN